MGKKVHYKLHKVKKQWVTIAVTSAALASIVGGATVANQKVSADEATEPVASTTAESDVVVETHEVAAPAATATTDAAATTNDKAADTATVATPAAATTTTDTTTNTAAPTTTDRAAVANGATTETPAAAATDVTLTVAEQPKSGVTEKEETAADSASLFFNATKGKEAFTTIQNNLVEITLDNKGGRVYSALLKNYMGQDKKPVVLFNGSDASTSITRRGPSRQKTSILKQSIKQIAV